MRTFSRAGTLPVLLLAAVAGCAPAATRASAPQDAAYARTPGETLRYTWQTELYDSRGGDGGQWDSVSARRSVRVAIAFTGGDTARGWIEAMWMQPTGENARADTAGHDVVGQAYVLRIGPLGSDSVLAIPRLPGRWSNAQTQFNGFFPRLPGGPLTPGRAWSESNTVDISDSLWTGEYTRFVQYQVVGDSTIHGAQVVVVAFDMEATSQIRRRPGGPELPPNLPYRPEMVQTRSNEEHGRFYFEPRTGRLLRRIRSGSNTLVVPSFTAPEPVVFEDRYRSTIELVRGRRR